MAVDEELAIRLEVFIKYLFQTRYLFCFVAVLVEFIKISDQAYI